MAEPQTQPTHVAILPSPGMGHLIPLVELAKRIVSQHNDLFITFIVPTDGSPSKAQKLVLESLPTTISSTFLPPVDLSDLPEDTKIETVISITVARSLPSVRDVLKSLVESTRLVALVVDLFGTDAFDVAREFSISPYIFFPSTAMTLSLFFRLPKLDETVSCEYSELEEPVEIPGCIPVHGKELLDPVQDRKNDAYKWLLHHTKRYRLADGIMVNSFVDMEGGASKALQEEEPGFLDRTKGRGLVVPSWAPQAQVLSHGSTGGFLTHCGWNSTLESVVNGVPLISWPLYAEQKMNAVMLTDDIKVALRPRINDQNGLIESKEIERVVRGLMEGEEGKKVRHRMKDLKDAAARVLSEEGSSAKALSGLVLKWKNQKCK
ncbi:hypothetical protein GH714_033752 [Hevea brasiliensis]|uniref:anthocyanidin 3-O-glucosyltransferase n=1 Tax=Hevea brasiliensis TaxID=3981 RepID=A0A6A6LL87_HEVBR|nr:hypothetical protein GH714_033752 [Hevea brasiliensis]